MRWLLSALIDAGAVALAGFAGFWLGFHVTACKDVSSCGPLAPVTVVAVVLFVAVYFAVGHFLLGRTPGEWLLRVKQSEDC
jgi:hypothetical protein